MPFGRGGGKGRDIRNEGTRLSGERTAVILTSRYGNLLYAQEVPNSLWSHAVITLGSSKRQIYIRSQLLGFQLSSLSEAAALLKR